MHGVVAALPLQLCQYGSHFVAQLHKAKHSLCAERFHPACQLTDRLCQKPTAAAVCSLVRLWLTKYCLSADLTSLAGHVIQTPILQS